MSSGHGANFAEVIKEDFVKEICPGELHIFLRELENNESIDLGEFTQDVVPELVISRAGNDKDTLPYIVAYVELCLTFEQLTGLSLKLAFHDQESEGDCYDEVDGVYWRVGNVYQLTPAGEKYKNKIERAFYVTAG